MSEKMVKSVYAYFKKYSGESLNPVLIKDIHDQVIKGEVSRDDGWIFAQIISVLRHEFGYYHPVEEIADKAHARSLMARLIRKRNIN